MLPLRGRGAGGRPPYYHTAPTIRMPPTPVPMPELAEAIRAHILYHMARIRIPPILQSVWSADGEDLLYDSYLGDADDTHAYTGAHNPEEPPGSPRRDWAIYDPAKPTWVDGLFFVRPPTPPAENHPACCPIPSTSGTMRPYVWVHIPTAHQILRRQELFHTRFGPNTPVKSCPECCHVWIMSHKRPRCPKCGAI